MKYLLLITFIYILFPCRQSFSQDTFPPLKDRNVPQTIEELWKDYDPGKEPLDTEILKEWEEDGVVMKVLRYRIGIKVFRLGAQESLNEKMDSENKKLELGAKWIGERPKFRNLRWLDI